MTALMRNGRDRRLGEPVMGHARLERVRLFGTRSADYIRASGHTGCIAQRQSSKRRQAEYMTAPERFADSQIPLAPRAPSIHDPTRTSAAERRVSCWHPPIGGWDALPIAFVNSEQFRPVFKIPRASMAS